MIPTVPDSKETLITELHSGTLGLLWSYQQDLERLLEPFGLNPLKAVILDLLGCETRHPKDLSDLLTTSPPAVSTLIGDLEARGLVRRSLDETDRRRVLLNLTPKGEKVRHKVNAAWQRFGLTRLGNLSLAELQTLNRIQTTLLETR